MEGEVVDVILATDVQGSNIIGAVNKDEEVFASIGTDSIKSVGQIVGVCIATTLSAAKEAAKAVKVSQRIYVYPPPPPYIFILFSLYFS